VLGVPVLGVHEDAVAAGLAGEVLLGQRRAFVGPVFLVADERELPVEALLAQRFGCLGTGQSGTHDHEMSRCHGYQLLHMSPSVRRSRG
jgi:hypothetical protein